MDQHIKKELDKIAPGFPERKRYQVPEGYFDHLPEKVIVQWDKHRTPSGPTIVRFRQMISSAAMVAGICFAIAFFTQPTTAPSLAGQVTAEDAYDYICYHIEEFEPLLDFTHYDTEYEDFQTITPDDVEEYLLEEFSGSELEQIF